MEEEYLMKCVVDTAKRSFYLYSNEGDEKVVECETMEQFMNDDGLLASEIDLERIEIKRVDPFYNEDLTNDR